MQTKNFLLLAALTASTTIGSLAIAPSAEAILYNVNAQLDAGDGGGTVTGTFDFDGATYTSWNLTVSGNTNTLAGSESFNKTYDSSNGSFLTSSVIDTSTGNPYSFLGNGGGPSSSSLLAVALRTNPSFGTTPEFTPIAGNGQNLFYLVLAFDPALMTNSSSNIQVGNAGSLTGSYTRAILNGGSAADEVIVTPQGSATPVPIESDALPVVGAAAFMAGGLWFKRRRAQAKADLEFLNNNTEKSA